MIKKYKLNKKAVATSIIVPLVLGLVFAGLFLAGPLKGVVNFTLDKLSDKGFIGERISDDGFVPYESKLSDDDLIVENSIKALQCAISNTAKGGEFDASLCDEGGIDSNKDCSGANKKNGLLYGSSCVTCEHITGPSLTDANAIEKIGQNMLLCFGQYASGDVKGPCHSFNTYQLSEKFSITEDKLTTWLNENGGKTGRDLTGEGATVDGVFSGFVEFNIKDWDWNINDDKNGDDIITKKSPASIIIYSDGSGNLVLDELADAPKDLKEKYEKNINIKLGLSCYVENFNLPQKIDKDLAHPANFVAGYGDPNYLLYYEAFEQDAAKFWQISGVSPLSIGVIIAFAAIDAYPGVKELSVAGKEAAEQAIKVGTKEIIEHAAKESISASALAFIKDFQELGLRRALLSLSLKNSAVLKGTSQELAEEIAKIADESAGKLLWRLIKRSPESIKNSVIPGIKKVIDTNVKEVPEEFLEKVLKENLEIDDLIKNSGLGDDLIKLIKNGADEATITENLLKSQKLSDFMQGKSSEEGLNILNGISKKASNAMHKTSNEVLDIYKDQLVKDMSEEIAERYSVDITRQILAANSQKKAIVKMFTDAASSPEFFEQNLKKAHKTFSSLTIKDKRFVTQYVENTLSSIKSSIPSPNNIIEGVKTRANIFKKDLKGAWTNRGLKNVNWKKEGKRAGIIAMVYLSAMQDSLNEKYASVGSNSLGLDRPGLIASPKDYKLSSQSLNYFISMRDSENELRNKRLYLVSPCNADLVIKKEVCTCKRMPSAVQHYMFGSQTFPIDVKGILIDEKFFINDKLIIDNYKKNIPERVSLLNKEEEFTLNFVKETFKRDIKRYNKLKNKYSILNFTNSKELNNKDDAVVALERYNAIKFFDANIEGDYVAGIVNQDSDVWFGREVYDFWFADQNELGNNWPAELNSYLAPFFNSKDATKYCFSGDDVGSSIGYLIDSARDKNGINSNPFTTPLYNPECITVTVNRIAEGKANYCIDEYHTAETVKSVLTGSTMALSVLASAFTGGTAAPFAIAGVGVATGLIEEYVSLYTKWPGVEQEGPLNKIPTVNDNPSEKKR